jgi:hypothetical protein
MTHFQSALLLVVVSSNPKLGQITGTIRSRSTLEQSGGGSCGNCRFDTACQPADGHFAAALASTVSAFQGTVR